MATIIPNLRTAPCPVCSQPVTGWEFTAGWAAQSIFGTQVGNYGDSHPVPDGAEQIITPFPALDRYLVQPCGDEVSAEEMVAIRREMLP